jgi:hypothetical protein
MRNKFKKKNQYLKGKKGQNAKKKNQYYKLLLLSTMLVDI